MKTTEESLRNLRWTLGKSGWVVDNIGAFHKTEEGRHFRVKLNKDAVHVELFPVGMVRGAKLIQKILYRDIHVVSGEGILVPTAMMINPKQYATA